MSMGEMLFLIFAMILLSTLILSVNTSLFQASDFAADGTIGMYAISVAQQYIEKAKQLAYDETAVSGYPANLPMGFTSPFRLGPESGESYPQYDDVDDFNGFNAQDQASMGKFSAAITVVYVNELDPRQQGQAQTFAKRMVVTVTSPYLRAPIRLTHIFTYFKK